MESVQMLKRQLFPITWNIVCKYLTPFCIISQIEWKIIRLVYSILKWTTGSLKLLSN